MNSILDIITIIRAYNVSIASVFVDIKIYKYTINLISMSNITFKCTFMNKLFLLILTVLVFSNCQEKVPEIFPIYIDVSIDSQAYLSEIAQKVDKVELETTDNSLIREIRNVEMMNNHYFVNHGVFSTEVLMFDNNGRFVKQIGAIGRGPGEYTALTQIAVDTENQTLFVNTRQGIMIFDTDGSFVQTINLRLPTFMLVHNKQLYCLNSYSESLDEISVSLTTHNIIDWNLIDSVSLCSYSSVQGQIIIIGQNHNLSQSKQNIYFYYPWVRITEGRGMETDTLFMFKNHKLEPHFTIQFTGKKLAESRGVVKVVMTNNYGIITHSLKVEDPNSQYGKSVYSQYYIDLSTMKGKNATNGFIDDFHSGTNVIITPIPNTDKFYYYIEDNDYSLELQTSPNPTLYIGTFK